MENMETLEHFDNTISLYKKLFRIEPEIIAHDLHPDYLSTKYAQELSKSSNIKLIPVQHHHAHITSCMADNRLESSVIGVAFDGTGMGSDGHIWGGEFLVADYYSFDRVGHLEYLPLPGGDAAIKRPYRTAVGYVLSLLGKDTLKAIIASGAKHPPVAFIGEVSEIEVGIIKRQIESGLNSPLTSSMGRLFDAVSALMNIRGEIDYEGQAAVELEMAAYACHCEEHSDEAISNDKECYPYRIIVDEGMRIVQLRDLLSAIIEDLEQGISSGRISVRFHNTIARMTDEMCRLIADETGINQVALSGGVFQNRLLLRETIKLLENSGFQVFTHRQAPCNDGGISLGQAVVANFAE
jgi:hydrogenase maturation protein HypF